MAAGHNGSNTNQAEAINLFLNAGTWENIYKEKYCPSHFPAAFVLAATIYQHWSQGVELDGPLL